MPHFVVTRTSRLSAETIGEGIFDLANWATFTGYGPIPGIARVSKRNDAARVGTIFEVENTDGSTHRETVVAYEPGRRLELRMDHFSAPLNRIAEAFHERWTFATTAEGCVVQRHFDLKPKGLTGRVQLAMVAPLLKQAVGRHMDRILAAPGGSGDGGANS